MFNIFKNNGIINSHHQYFWLFFCLFLSGCSKTQDDIKLPVLDSIGGNFTLPSTLGTPISLSDYKGKVVLINFGYTSCPDVCPMILTDLSKLRQKLKQQDINSHKFQTIFISVDPERDTIDHLKQYLDFFDSSFVGISGTIEQTLEVTKKYAVFFEKLPSDKDDYQVAHNDKIFLMDKRGRLRGLYSHSNDETKLFNDIVNLIEADF